MDYLAFSNVVKWMEEFSIPEIHDDTNFWMIRSKSGYFYEEYLKYGFIALGWNYIDQSTVIDSQNIEIIKEGIKNRYGDKRPTYAINKCKRFIHEL